MLKRVIFIIIILCSLKFFQLFFIPEFITKISEWIGIGLICSLLLVYAVYSREGLMKMHFSLPIVLILISVFISMFAAYGWHGQSFAITAYAQRAVYFYFIYYLLHYMKIPGGFIIRTILVFAIIYALLYIVQYNLFPRPITNAKMFIDRGTLRIFLDGAGFLVISYFIWLYFTFRGFRLKYGLFLLLALAVFVLLGTRQVIAAIVLLTILFVLQSKVVKSKILIFTLIGLSVIPVYFLFQDIIYAMFEVTLEQSEGIESNVRVRATKYFLTEFYTNNFAYVTGNGANGNSMYGIRVIDIAQRFSFYQSDIGLIGEYTKFGMLFLVGVFMLLYRVLKIKLPDKLMFVKYNFLGIIITLVTGAGVFASSGINILINSTLIYLVDLHLNDSSEFSEL